MAEITPGVKAISDGELQLVVFKIGVEEFGVEIMKVQEIIRMTNITRIPQAPDYIRGIINLRGKIIVVINLNVVLGMETKEQDENTRIIVANIDDTVMGFVVDSVSEVIRLPQKSVEPAPAVIADKIGTEYVMGVGNLDNRLLILLNLNKILGAKELHSVRSISTDAAEEAATT
ncbi:chemotaxis protein CheW [Candidatus Methanoperedens nitratireducens]|uniref:Chemotaxis protein CheW n=1 Tax=Candidatus Methanoperedens nitratireducens TaxID=1392998 RepID=A0A284VI17_9EURY|nr:chemotaxis protein CheW [Candidatus Methanoperedens nitroreducens]SNQ58902.1 Chemotaxis protein CheW [Candidatus Methanoperedens nitroreducens]